MKLAIKIIAIIGAVLAVIGMILSFVFAGVINIEEMIKEGIKITYNNKVLTLADTEEIEILQKVVQILGVVFGVLCIIPIGINVAAIVVVSINPQVNAPYIVIGALALFLGAFIIGVLLLIYGVTKEYDNNKPNKPEYIYNN